MDASGYEAVRHGAGLVERNRRARLAVTGHDRVGWLQGLLTNDVAALAPGTGCYATFLTPQGRMIADLHVLVLEDVVWLEVLAAAAAAVLERLDMYIISEDVRLADVTSAFDRVGVHGPQSAEVLARVLAGWAGHDSHAAVATRLQELAEDHHAAWSRSSDGAEVAHVTGNRDSGEPGFDVSVPVAQGPALRAALADAGARPVDAAAWDVLRIEAGRPLFGADMDTDTIPLEAGLEDRAISFTKGCYVGQEIIVRVRDRGQGRVAKKLVGLVAPEAGAPALAPGDALVVPGTDRDAGRITSAGYSPSRQRMVALGIVARDLLEPGTVLHARHAGAAVPVVVTALPMGPALPPR